MTLKRKLAAVLAAAVMAAAVAGCGENTAVACTVDGMEIRAGIYLYYAAFSSYYDAQDLMPEDADTKATMFDKDITLTDSEGQAIADPVSWIKDQALEEVKKYVAVERKFDEMGLSFTENDKKKVAVTVNNVWSQYEKEFTNEGISKQSISDIYTNREKRDRVFKEYYGENGTEPVSQQEQQDYFKENFARVKMIAIQLKDGEGNLLKSADKVKAKEMAEDYVSRATPDNMDELIKEYQDYYDAQVEAAKKAAEEDSASSEDNSSENGDLSSESSSADADSSSVSSGDSSSESGDSSSESSTADADSSSVSSGDSSSESGDSSSESSTADADSSSESGEEGENAGEEPNPYENEQILNIDGESPSKTLVDAVFQKAKVGEPLFVEDDEVYYVVMRYDIMDRTELYDSVKDSMLSIMKGEDFEKLIDQWAESLKLSVNDAAYQRYNPKKFHK